MTEPAAIPRPDTELPPPPAPLSPLYTPSHIVVGALLGTPMAAGVMWRANMVALGKQRAWLAVLIGGLATGLLCVVGALVTRPIGFIPVILAISLRQPARFAFPAELVASAGKRSWRRALGVTVLTTVAVLFALFAGLSVAAVLGGDPLGDASGAIAP